MSTIHGSPIGPATTAKRGTMSAADKTKLDGIPEGGGSGAVTAVTEANGLTLTTGTLAMAAAGAAAAGAVTTGAQEFGGAKTLTGAILAGVTTITEAVVALVRAVGVSLVLRSSLGAGASDKCVVVGSSEVDGTVNAAARLQEWQTGIGGTPVTKAYLTKAGALALLPASGTSLDLSANVGAGGSVVQLANGAGINFSLADSDAYFARTASNTIRMGGGSTGTLSAATFAALVSLAGPRLQINTGDSTGTPGNATVNFSAGKSAIAVGANTCTITTNQSFGVNDLVHLTPLTINTGIAKWSAVASNGSFTVTTDGNAATAPWEFQWQVVRKNN